MTKQEEKNWWAKQEERADREMELGLCREFESVEELIADLHSLDTIYCPLCGSIYYSESASEIHCVGCNANWKRRDKAYDTGIKAHSNRPTD